MNSFDNDEPDSSGIQPDFLTRFVATGFFSGYIPWASGTFGALVGALFFLIPGFTNIPVLTAAIVVAFFAGVVTSAKIASAEGHKLTQTARRMKERFQPGEHGAPDPSIVVIDEIVGVWIAMIAIPLTLPGVAVAFFAFRLFDIVKPYPVRQVEHISSGWGIMLDDVVAGIYANIATRLVMAFLYAYLPELF
ncbi:MAG: phosphatidylglycerophosphatase A [Bacteroidetes bacterium]|nr:phosphatidylglycerophosphatase A [Bacteroidota bacterium]MCW5894373.1 phosphatidylglycerophosphatase A [Bacteroidota bacterium]